MNKPVFIQWIRRLSPDLTYEPFLANGKRKSLALRKSLRQDLGNLREGVYFFVDRDFDDLQGTSPIRMFS